VQLDPAFKQPSALSTGVAPNTMSKPIVFYDMATGLNASVSWNTLKTK
jgi:hypothetical protein